MSETADFSARQDGLAIVLAAGEGTRMRSSKPKVLHAVAGKPMLAHVLDVAAGAGIAHVAAVIGPDRADVAQVARESVPDVQVFEQRERLGTAHAVLAAREALQMHRADVLVLFGDNPLIRVETLMAMRARLAQGAAVAALGFMTADPTGYGRFIVEDGELIAIREHKDASEEERQIRLCNGGMMALAGPHALAILERIGNDNAQKEYYLTDAIAVARSLDLVCAAVVVPEEETLGVNDRVQLATAEAVLQRRLRDAAMRAGATLIAPETVFLSHDTKLGRDVLIEPHVVFGAGVTVEDGAVIHAFSHLEGATVASGASVGPYARLRPGADLAAGAKVGNFVEVKAARIGPGAKVNHLTYIGDAEIGAKANIGAGTITCNYDGFEKFKTLIGEGAFIGSNSSLVAPVSIGDGAFVGSGSVVTEDVPADALAVARGRQAIKPDWAKAFRAEKAMRKAKGKPGTS
jgi:bifunctional UDP-N-acetylglucosamine pyrophosphorylase / glucosamine-1-phosphate N-acetyltransferase